MAARMLMASAVAVDAVAMYFGNGCYWARQHLFVSSFEQAVLSRAADQITGVAGYAGSKRTGPGGQLCYHNEHNVSDYGLLGHAEAVHVEVPAASLKEAFSVFFGSFVESSPGVWDRPDFYNLGAEYRSIVGFSGGIFNEAVMAQMQKANLHNMTLVEGKGSDEDTFQKNKVLVMDSDVFPFAQAELCMQFRDDTQVKYPQSYHELKTASEKQGRVHPTTCPANAVCGPDKPPPQQAMLI
uniref:Peptide-methionine (S)-S-oxide reductase n=1 Tax=Alexandrium andersonii TaxID=327968 RepID=A0A7S2N1D5_9DINO